MLLAQASSYRTIDKTQKLLAINILEHLFASCPTYSREDTESTIDNLTTQMKNLFKMVQFAQDDDALETLMGMYQELEKQKKKAEALLFDIDEDEEERAVIEAELVKFENGVKKVQPDLTIPAYVPTYEDQRLAIRILGIKAKVYPTIGNYPYRAEITVTVPGIMKKMVHSASDDSSSGWATMHINFSGVGIGLAPFYISHG